MPALLADDPVLPAKKGDLFFAGAIKESNPEKLTVSRTVLGKSENRTFLVTPDTKMEGQLALGVRVTVQYTTDEYGDTATRVVVRPPVAPAPARPKKK